MLSLFASGVVVLSGLYLIGLGILAWSRPEHAGRFLLGHASSASLHFLEMSLRLFAGTALVIASARMLWPPVFAGFGWLLIVSSAVLVIVPWRFHQRFARLTVPRMLPHLRLVGASSILIGGALLAGALLPALR